MGAYTPTAKVWYADTTDSAKLDTVTSTMASSIENGLGARMTLRETQVGLKASVDNWTIPTTANTTVPVSVTTSYADFNAGFSLSSGGVATVQTPGMYLVTASVGPRLPDTAGSNASCQIYIQKNGASFASAEVAFNTVSWITAQSTCVINCIAGDTIQMQAKIAGTPGSAHTTQQSNTFLSVVLVNATHT